MNESESKEALENTYRDTEASSIVKDCEVEIEDDVVEDDVLEDDTDDEYYVKTNTVQAEQNNGNLNRVSKIPEEMEGQ